MNKLWIGLGGLVALLAAVPVAAQVAQDFPNLKGFGTRTGRNGDPAGSGPGVANLRWFAPNGVNARTSGIVIDDTDTDPPSSDANSNPYTFEPNNLGFVTFDAADWSTPTLNGAALDAFTLPIRRTPDVGTGAPTNTAQRTPFYRFTRATAAAIGDDPTVADNPANLRTFTWTFRALSPARQFGLWVYLPVQPTTDLPLIGGDTDPLGRVFPQRYYVYRINFGNGQSRTEIIDSYANNGWVRLGNGGGPSNATYTFDGISPVSITLYNTVPRGEDNRLLLPAGLSTSQGPSNVLVYADAVRAIPEPGTYSATPTSARLTDTDVNSTVVTAAVNTSEVGVNPESGEADTFSNAEVTNYNYQNGSVRWTYSPVAQTTATLTGDDSTATLLGAWSQDATIDHQVGTSPSLALMSAATTAAGATASAQYNFNVDEDGSYAIFAYIPPDTTATYPLAQSAQYEIDTFNPATSAYETTTVTVNQESATGWVRLGTRFYHDVDVDDEADTPLPIRVRLIDYSPDAADRTARYVYADAIRVVGEASIGISSSPVHATALVRQARGVDPVETKVVFLADENGVIHCLDATGNGDGTTREYWSYPSSRDTAGYDPNLGPITGSSDVVAGEDWSGPGNTPADERTPTAAMPSGFDLSTAVVQRVDVTENGNPAQRDRLYIAARNGRVYCIDVTGRGDGDGSADPISAGTRSVGTTTRVWTYPSTYPSDLEVEESRLGSFIGSIAYSDTNGATAGGETLYVPAPQGRMYALDAIGNPTNKTTTPRWTYPDLDEPTLGPLVSTPSVEFGNVYFGTRRNTTDAGGTQPGQIIALEADTGNLVWSFNRTDTAETATVDARFTDDFESSLITIPGTNLANGIDTVVALNQNQVMYWINAADGALIYATDELAVGATASLGFTYMTPYDNTGAVSATQVPIILVPASDGRFMGVYANVATFDVFGSKIAWGYEAAGSTLIASMSTSNGWMYGADSAGHLYAWNAGTGIIVDGEIPGSEIITGNNPLGNRFRKTKVALINADTFRALRQAEGAAGRSYQNALAGVIESNVQEWGQSLYVLVYDFPYQIEDADGDPVDPPVVNIQFSFRGRNTRQSVVSRSFDTGTGTASVIEDPTVPNFFAVAPAGPMPGVSGNPRLNGFAVLPFPITNGGQNALPPGNGRITVSMQTTALSGNGALQTVALPPNVWSNTIAAENVSWSQYPITVANPLAIIVPPSSTTTPSLTTTSQYSLGFINNPGQLAAGDVLRQEALQDQAVDIPGSTKLENLLGTNTPQTSHGLTGKARLWVVDRSYMALLRPGGVFGLDNVRIDRRDLAWQGGAATVIKPLNNSLYPNFEDYPVNYPNVSLDYPDLSRDSIKVTKDPNGSAENPLFNGVALLAPRTASGPLTESTDPADRIFFPTPFEIEVSVPRFQPANNRANLAASAPSAVVLNSAGAALDQQGYLGRINVFVDSTTNGQLDSQQREAHRSLNLAAAVGMDERLRVTTPVVDLGSLPGGAGVDPSEALPGSTFNVATDPNLQQNSLNPWASRYGGIFKSFSALNEGNVNLLNVRTARATNIDTAAGATLPLTIEPNANDPLAWLNGAVHIHSDIDQPFAPGPLNSGLRPTIFPKPRVGDRVATQLKANPTRRPNPNLGVTGIRTISGNNPSAFPDVLNESLTGPIGSQVLQFPSGDPRVGVSVPIGMPSGGYETSVLLFEDTTSPFSVWNIRSNLTNQPGGREPYSESGFTLKFNVVETRLTNTFTPLTAPMLDDILPGGTTEAARFSNTAPAVARHPDGDLVVAFSSNRTPGSAASAADFNQQGRSIYLGSLNNSGGSLSGVLGGPMMDLDVWQPAGGSWFAGAAVESTNPFGTNLVGPLRLDDPAFPVGGWQSPWVAANLFSDDLPMAFVIRGTVQTPSGQRDQSHLALSWYAKDSAAALTRVGTTAVSSNDPLVEKSEPAILYGADSHEPLVFYTGTTGGRTWGYYTRVTPTSGGHAFGPSSPLPFGDGFLSVRGISVAGRLTSASPPTPEAVITFSAQLKGRPNTEVFMARAALGVGPYRLSENADGTLADDVFSNLSPVNNERLEREAPGVFRTRGVNWDTTQGITLFQIVGSNTTDLLVAASRQVDRETGLIRYETRLGGEVVIDPAQGLIRFTRSAPTGSATVYASYTPRFLRISDGGRQGTGSTKTGMIYDGNAVSNLTYWFRADGTGVTSGAGLTNERFIATWNQSAGGGVTARPYMKSMRFGMVLPSKLPTLPDGRLGYYDNGGNAQRSVTLVQWLTPTGWQNVNAFQADPVNGRIYISSFYEGQTVRVFHATMDEQGGVYPPDNANPTIATIGIVDEVAGAPVPIETAVNESNLTTILDPLTSMGSYTRPPLLWMFWSSTRGGVPDVYFQSIAPRWYPTAVAK